MLPIHLILSRAVSGGVSDVSNDDACGRRSRRSNRESFNTHAVDGRRINPDVATAVILAAGEGQWVEPLTNRRPKPMVPVGHAVLQAEPVADGPFLVLNGDRIVDADAVSAVSDRLRDGDAPLITVTAVESPRDYGVVQLTGDRVTEIDEKPKGPVDINRINAGVYGFTPRIFDAIRATDATGELAITATLNDLIERNKLTSVGYDGRWLDVSNLWDVLTVNAALIHDSDRARDAPATGQRVADTVTVADDVMLAGNVHIGPNATLSGATAIESNVTIAANAVVENSVIFPDAVIGPGAVVRDAVVAGNARIGPNTTITGGPATVVHRDVTLGGVVGDNASIGGGATLTDGAVVGDDVRADAGVVIDGRVESGAVVRRG